MKNIKRDRGVRLRVRILQKVIPVPSPDQDRPYVEAPPAAVHSRLTQGLQGCFDRGKGSGGGYFGMNLWSIT